VEKLCSGLSGDVPVFFLGGRNDAAVSTGKKLAMSNEQLAIAGAYEGSPRDEDVTDIVCRINALGAKLLLVAYGAPAQDLWIAKHLSRMPSVRVAIGVGGTFDFLAGNIRRAPQWMRSLGIEWLWRVIVQPWRIGRILIAVMVFPFMVFTSKKREC
jgi:N-acetylglucosaminyldiphosphoundecaprenol N-acetyl-beta-D-mannosaminyltransferase